MHASGIFIKIHQKSVIIVFNKYSIRVNLSIKVFNYFVPQCDHVIYAGCLLQENLKADKCYERVFKSARSKIHSLYKVGLNSFQLSPVVCTTISKRVVLPTALYACELWSSLSNEDIRKLQVEYIQRHFQE